MNYIATPERREGPGNPMPKAPSPSDEGGGPKRPESGSPDKDNLLKRMRKATDRGVKTLGVRGQA
jgi:hypothetical protein